jgi:hypothetical protein
MLFAACTKSRLRLKPIGREALWDSTKMALTRFFHEMINYSR